MTDGPKKSGVCGWAALYVLGSTNDAQQQSFAKHASECPACAEEMRSYAHTIVSLAGETTQWVGPSPEVKQQLLASIRGTEKEAAAVFEKDGLLIVSSENLPWQLQAMGISSKVLRLDSKRNYVVSIVRMAPGVHYPAHKHRDLEEVFLLEGDLNIEGRTLQAGDYCRAEPESVHGEGYTVSGCTFVLHASLLDEIIDRDNRELQA